MNCFLFQLRRHFGPLGWSVRSYSWLLARLGSIQPPRARRMRTVCAPLFHLPTYTPWPRGRQAGLGAGRTGTSWKWPRWVGRSHKHPLDPQGRTISRLGRACAHHGGKNLKHNKASLYQSVDSLTLTTKISKCHGFEPHTRLRWSERAVLFPPWSFCLAQRLPLPLRAVPAPSSPSSSLRP